MKKLLLIAASLLVTIASYAGPGHVVKLKNGSYASVQACSEGIFRVRVSKTNSFEESLMERYGLVTKDWPKGSETISDSGSKFVITSGGVKLTINKKDGSVTVTDAAGKALMGTVDFFGGASSEVKALNKVLYDRFSSMVVANNGGGIIGDDKGKFNEKDVQEGGDPDACNIVRITLAGDERIYGGGSTSREHIQHRGEILRMWTTYQHTEMPMPFMMSSRGWGVYNNNTEKSYFDVAATSSDKMNIYSNCPDADVFLFFGKDMPAILNLYTQTTGRSYVLPKYAYGFCFGPNMKEKQFDILNDAIHFKQYEVPVDLFWLEPQWMTKRYDFSTKKAVDPEKFSFEPYWKEKDFPKKEYGDLFVGRLHGLGIRLGLWLCEEYDLSITEEDEIARREGRPESGKVHWMDHLTTFLDYGVDGFKLDPARTIDEHKAWNYYNGLTDREMHNINQTLLPKQCINMARKHTGKRIWEHYCGGWSAVQRYGAATSGDNGGGKTALYDQINLSMSGYMNISCDVMSVEPEIQMESLHFGMFIPWVQVNSWFSLRHPFYFNEAEQGVYRDYVQYRYSIMPYIYSLALACNQTGMPMLRAMPLEFPDDRNCDDMCYQYMFGPSYCVAIFDNNVYLPAGVWHDAWTGERIVSKGETITRAYAPGKAGLLFIKDGSIIPMQDKTMHVGTAPVENFTLRVFPAGESQFTIYEDDGETFAFESGALARTLVTSSEKNGNVDIVVNPTVGRFDGQPARHTYKFEILCQSKPSKVTVSGKEVEWSYGEDGFVRFEKTGVALDDKVTVSIR